MRSGYLAELRASTDPQDETRVENLAELAAVAGEFEAANPDGTVTDFLETVSLTGLPQPLAYVIESTAARHGLIRVERDEASVLTRVVSDDPATIATIGEANGKMSRSRPRFISRTDASKKFSAA